METLMARNTQGSFRPDWQRGRYERIQDAHKPGSQDGDTAPRLNRSLLEGAVRDPTVSDRSRIRLKINADLLDRELHAHRINDSEYAAGRAYQRLFEISMGSPSLEGAGSRDKASVRDDHIVRLMDRAKTSVDELVTVSEIVGLRSAMVIRQLLCEINMNTGKAWTFEELSLSLYGDASRRVVFSLQTRFREALADLAKHWERVEA